MRKDRLTARNGSSYLSLELRDRSGTLPARVFREADRLGLRFKAGDAVEVKGRIERFRGDLVAELDDVERLEPGSYDPGAFLPAAYRSVEELQGFLEHLVSEIHHDGLRKSPLGSFSNGQYASGVPPGALHPVGPPRLPRRASRAHSRRRHARA